jgi:hypothetical protein
MVRFHSRACMVSSTAPIVWDLSGKYIPLIKDKRVERPEKRRSEQESKVTPSFPVFSPSLKRAGI